MSQRKNQETHKVQGQQHGSNDDPRSILMGFLSWMTGGGDEALERLERGPVLIAVWETTGNDNHAQLKKRINM